MRKIILNSLCLIFISVLFVSCEKMEMSDQLSTKSNTSNLHDSNQSRVKFADLNEFEECINDTIKKGLNSIITESKYFEDSSPLLKNYLKYTPLTKILNKEGEFQIGETIYKIGKSGYAEFLIPANRYKEALSIIEKESDIISNISSYEKNSDGLLILSDSILMVYTGEPMLQTQKIESSTLRNSTRVLNYEVDVRFWTSSSFFVSACGIEMSYQEGSRDYDTDLEMIWNYIVVINKEKSDPGIGEMIPIASGNKIDTGSYDKKTFDEKTGFNVGKYRYTLYRGTLVGKAKHSNGSWVSDSFSM